MIKEHTECSTLKSEPTENLRKINAIHVRTNMSTLFALFDNRISCQVKDRRPWLNGCPCSIFDCHFVPLFVLIR